MQKSITDYLANVEIYVVYFDQQTGASQASHLEADIVEMTFVFPTLRRILVVFV